MTDLSIDQHYREETKTDRQNDRSAQGTSANESEVAEVKFETTHELTALGIDAEGFLTPPRARGHEA